MATFNMLAMMLPGEVLFHENFDVDSGNFSIAHDEVSPFTSGGQTHFVQWEWHSGSTSSSGTGPSSGQGSSEGYLLFESSYPVSQGDVAR